MSYVSGEIGRVESAIGWAVRAGAPLIRSFVIRYRDGVTVRASQSGSIRTESPDVTVTKRHKQSPSFLSSYCFEVSVVAMGVLNRAKAMSGLAASEEDGLPYVCLACETALEVRHYTCPVCGSFDVRCSKWVRE